jgi:voltage-gated potassium channel
MFNQLKGYKRFLLPVVLLNGLVVVGTLGYILLEDYSFINAFYMTIITIATVGYGEIEPLSTVGRIFTSFLIITSFGTFAYAVSTITKFVIDGEINEFLKNKRLTSAIEKLENHVIICGYGRNGRQAANLLKKHDTRFVVIENNEKLTGAIHHKYSELIVSGDGTQDDILIKAGILKAKALITTLPVDADNLFIVLTARHLNPNLTIISRASDKVGGAHMASLVMKPDVMEFVDYITAQGGDNINLEEISFSSSSSDLLNKTLKDLEIRNKSGANIIGFKTAMGEYIVNPSADTKIIPHSKIFVLGTREQIASLKGILNS